MHIQIDSALSNIIFPKITKTLHCKNRFGKNSNYLSLYKEGHNTVRNKGDLDSVIKTKTSILAL